LRVSHGSERQEQVTTSRLRTWVQVGASLAALATTFILVDRAEIWRHLKHIQAGWLVLTLALLLFQFAVMAARWWLFARRLSAPLSYGRALCEYFLSGFLNQILPLGILGDVTRATRHVRAQPAAAQSRSGRARVVLALVLERASGQVALWLVVAAILPGWWLVIRAFTGTALVAALGSLLIVLVASPWLVRWWRAKPEARQLLSEGWRALVAPRNLVLHLPLSLILVAGHTLAFVTIARGLELHLELALALRVVPLVLVATTAPFFVAGWGVREATVAGLYHAAGLRPADGVTIALIYGCLSLVATVPGILVLSRAYGADEGLVAADGRPV